MGLNSGFKGLTIYCTYVCAQTCVKQCSCVIIYGHGSGAYPVRNVWELKRTWYSNAQGHSWKANWFSASHEIPCILWNPKVHHRVYKSLPPVLIPAFNCIYCTYVMYAFKPVWSSVRVLSSTDMAVVRSPWGMYENLSVRGILMHRVILEKLTGSRLVTKFLVFYGTRRFITAFTRACHLSLSRPLTVRVQTCVKQCSCYHLRTWQWCAACEECMRTGAYVVF